METVSVDACWCQSAEAECAVGSICSCALWQSSHSGVQVRENLELSSTGRRIFSRLENAFEKVLVDEAAQASEIAVLQPLTLGCTR